MRGRTNLVLKHKSIGTMGTAFAKQKEYLADKRFGPNKWLVQTRNYEKLSGTCCHIILRNLFKKMKAESIPHSHCSAIS